MGKTALLRAIGREAGGRLGWAVTVHSCRAKERAIRAVSTELINTLQQQWPTEGAGWASEFLALDRPEGDLLGERAPAPRFDSGASSWSTLKKVLELAGTLAHKFSRGLLVMFDDADRLAGGELESLGYLARNLSRENLPVALLFTGASAARDALCPGRRHPGVPMANEPRGLGRQRCPRGAGRTGGGPGRGVPGGRAGTSLPEGGWFTPGAPAARFRGLVGGPGRGTGHPRRCACCTWDAGRGGRSESVLNAVGWRGLRTSAVTCRHALPAAARPTRSGHEQRLHGPHRRGHGQAAHHCLEAGRRRCRRTQLVAGFGTVRWSSLIWAPMPMGCAGR